ncbi:hypothetical protein E5676_scaffold637G00440 [Cucumis melo var. makuwa]|uniref:Uncharacterized protein n=1 Tax=Cucumis melo var. makuwa TaxID=1194695 RepID=A0A5D3CVC0_CUCMM|nr:hypothetical protein E5676_scaffold637G00440 [Cucumis melo var. makuwa]
MQSQPLQNLGATVNLWLFCSSTGSSSKPRGFLVFSDALSILEVHKSNQKLYWDIESGKSGKWDVVPRGNRPSLQTGKLDKTVIFLLSMLSVLRDNNTVVEIELPVPDTLPTSAKSSRQTPVRGWSCILSMFMLKCFVRLFYKPSDVRAASYVCWEVRIARIVRGDDVCWLHAIFRAKTTGGSGGGGSGAKRGCDRRSENLSLGEDMDGGSRYGFGPSLTHGWVALCAHRSDI